MPSKRQREEELPELPVAEKKADSEKSSHPEKKQKIEKFETDNKENCNINNNQCATTSTTTTDSNMEIDEKPSITAVIATTSTTSTTSSKSSTQATKDFLERNQETHLSLQTNASLLIKALTDLKIADNNNQSPDKLCSLFNALTLTKK